MANYFDKFSSSNANEFINLLIDRFPDLAIASIKYWEKEDKVKRFYINHKEGDDEVNFNLNITANRIFVNDYKAIFWNEVLGVPNVVEFAKEIEKIADEFVV